MRRRWLAGLAALLALLLLAPAAAADLLERPTGRVLLMVSGNLDVSNWSGGAAFDRDMLVSLGTVEMVTATPWNEAPVHFEGVPMARLLEILRIQAQRLLARASDGYEVEIPIAELVDHNALIAMWADGKELRMRSRGPLWLVFPWSEDPEVAGVRFNHYSIWQLREFEIL